MGYAWWPQVCGRLHQDEGGHGSAQGRLLLLLARNVRPRRTLHVVAAPSWLQPPLGYSPFLVGPLWPWPAGTRGFGPGLLYTLRRTSHVTRALSGSQWISVDLGGSRRQHVALRSASAKVTPLCSAPHPGALGTAPHALLFACFPPTTPSFYLLTLTLSRPFGVEPHPLLRLHRFCGPQHQPHAQSKVTWWRARSWLAASHAAAHCSAGPPAGAALPLGPREAPDLFGCRRESYAGALMPCPRWPIPLVCPMQALVPMA